MKKNEIKKLIHCYKIAYKTLDEIDGSECVKSVQPTGEINIYTCQPHWEYRINFVDGEQVICKVIQGDENSEIVRIPDPSKMNQEELKAFEKEVDEYFSK